MHRECAFERLLALGYVGGGLLRVKIGLMTTRLTSGTPHWATCVRADDEGAVRHFEVPLTGGTGGTGLLFISSVRRMACGRDTSR